MPGTETTIAYDTGDWGGVGIFDIDTSAQSGTLRGRLTGPYTGSGVSFLDANDLYTVRKEIGNYVQTAAKESGSWDKRLSAGLSGSVQGAIDDAIEGAAPGFKAYLQRYADMSKPIDQMKIMQDIRQRAQLTSTSSRFPHTPTRMISG